MAVETLLHIVSQDAQGYQADLTFFVLPAAFGATTLPTAAKIEAVIDAIYGDVLQPSNSIVLSYSIEVRQNAPTANGGSGGSPTSEAFRVRNGIGTVGEEFMFRIPGADKSSVIFDPTNPNSVVTSGANWAAIRTALADAGLAVRADAGSPASASTDLAEAVTVFDGRRAPMRPR